MKMTQLLVIASLSLLWGATMPSTLAAAGPAKIKVLVITGDDAMPSHNWREMTEATREVLVKSGKFDVVVCEDPLILESATALKAYDLIFLTRFHRTGTITDQAKENLLNFVRGGKGFAVSHLASASFKEWPEFRQLCGRNWVMGTSGHGPRSVFTAKIVNTDHPITQGSVSFDTDDELYAKLQGDTPIQVLAEADSTWSKKTEPLVFTLNYGQGRVFHETFGHDGKATSKAEVARIIVRGCQWAATGKVD